MARRWKWGLTMVLLATGIVCTGCDVLGPLGYFLLPARKEQPECKKLASEDNKKEVKVLILAYAGAETRLEFPQFDHELSNALYKQMKENFHHNEDKVSLIPIGKVQEFKNTHPGWQDMHPAEVGALFKVDYVISLEINSVSLYETGSAHMMYRGRSSVSVTLIEVKKPDEVPERNEFTCVYPTEAKGPEPVEPETPPARFREKFVGFMGKRLSWLFCEHEPADTYYSD
jgi:hypothetical protein